MDGSEVAQVRLLTDGRGHWQHHLLQWSVGLMALTKALIRNSTENECDAGMTGNFSSETVSL